MDNFTRTIRCLTLVISLSLHSAVNGQEIPFTDCGPGNVKFLSITPCTAMPCILNLGTQITLEAKFVSPINADSLTEVIKGIVRGRELPFPEKAKDPCDGLLTPSCPLVAGQEYTFLSTVDVKPFYPAIPIEVKYSLATPAGEMAMCFQAGAKIMDPNPKPKGRSRGKGKGR